jgi:hypothetical protein
MPQTDPYLGDTWLFTWSAGWSLLQSGVSDPSPTQPNARALHNVVPSGGAPLVVCGFSGYEGGLKDLFHNDVWAWNGA